ncbi:MAG: helix-turn-helix domain-containing protein [Ruminococcus flavefaciens]|nr:helix-turn-helix domain-containing protein [Ruminococcus flavefaciens]
MFYERFIQLCDLKFEKPTNVLKIIGASPGNLSNWKSGGAVKSDILMKLSEHFNVSVDYLLGRDDNHMESYNNTDTHLDEMSATLLDDFSKLETAEKARVIVMIDDMKKAKERK